MDERLEKIVATCPKPVADRVAVIQDEVEERTESGLYMVREREEKPHTGTVVAVGPGSRSDDGTWTVPLPFVVGDRVYHGRYAGLAIEVEGEEVIFMREDEIIAYEPQSEAF